MRKDILELYKVGYSIDFITNTIYNKLTSHFSPKIDFDVKFIGKITKPKVKKAVVRIIYDNLPVVDNQKYMFV